jgi:hypothetical protein
LPDAGGFFRANATKVNDGGLENDCPRLFGLACIHDVAASKCGMSATSEPASPAPSTDGQDSTSRQTFKRLLCLRGDWLRLFSLRSAFLAFYGHLKRSTQYVVIGKVVFPHEHEQVTPRSILHRILAQC